MEKNKGGNPNLSPDVSSLKLKDLGISHNQSSRMAQRAYKTWRMHTRQNAGFSFNLFCLGDRRALTNPPRFITTDVN